MVYILAIIGSPGIYRQPQKSPEDEGEEVEGGASSFGTSDLLVP